MMREYFKNREVGCFAKSAEINIPLLLMSDHSITVSTVAHVVGAECCGDVNNSVYKL